jgi:hypothetical protein
MTTLTYIVMKLSVIQQQPGLVVKTFLGNVEAPGSGPSQVG